jgi:DGQHR domain-containing protein
MRSGSALTLSYLKGFIMTAERYCDDRGNAKVLRVPALEVTQGPGRLLYSFAVDGKLLSSFATVSRIRRDDDNEIDGYQRPEVLSHIASIRRYLESEAPMIPNALVVAFDKRVQFFEARQSGSDVPYARQGTLVIPVNSESDDDKPGWIVDGQQRSAAIREAKIENFPICVTAFITDDQHEQRSQFILVNSTKPLPKGLIYELLPATVGTLPRALQTRKFPSVLLHRLNGLVASPFYRKIQTPTTPEGIIKDNSVLKMLETSLSDGALYAYRDPETGDGDEDQILELLIDFWSAVSEVFNYAWPGDKNNLTPRKSRLVHGVGIASMGLLMDAIYDRYSRVRTPTKEDFAADLTDMKDVCRWTHGTWDLGPGQQRKWNELQNTTRDIQLLTNYLLFEYKSRVWRKPIPERPAGA